MDYSAFALILSLAQAAGASQPIYVEVPAAGASAQVVADGVAVPLEAALSNLPGVNKVATVSRPEGCVIRLELDPAADRSRVQSEVTKRMDGARAKLTALAQQAPAVVDPAADTSFILVSLRSEQRSLTEMSALASRLVGPRLEQISGVVNVKIVGGAGDGIAVACDQEKLASLSMNISEVISGLRKAADTPPKALDDLQEVSVASKNGREIRVKDFAEIRGFVRPNTIARIFDKQSASPPVVFLVVQTKPREVENVWTALKKNLNVLTEELPEDVELGSRIFDVDGFEVVLRLPEGTKREEKVRVAEQAAQVVAQLKPVQAVYAVIRVTRDETSLFIVPNDARTAIDAQELRAALKELPGAHVRVSRLRNAVRQWPGEGASIVLNVSGPSPETTGQAAGQLLQRLSQSKGIADINKAGTFGPLLSLNLDRDKCKALGLDPADVELIVQAAHRDIEIANLKIDGTPVSLRLRRESPVDDLIPIDTVVNVRLVDSKGQPHPLSEVAKIEVTFAPTLIYREAGHEAIVISCNADGGELAATRDEVKKLATELSTNGVKIEVE